MIKRIFFDLDGTLINSDKLFWEANFKILQDLKKNVNQLEILKKYFSKSYGLTNILKEFNYSEQEIKHLKKVREKIYKDLLKKNVKYLPFVLETIATLKRKNISLWIVTTNTDVFISEINKKLNLTQYFEKIISNNDINKGKPAPDIYQWALKQSYPIKKEECIAIEDSPKGVISASQAGLKCIFIPNSSVNTSLVLEEFIDQNTSHLLVETIDKVADLV